MLDIQLLRSNLEDVAGLLTARGYSFPIPEFKALESDRKSLQTHTQELQARRNAVSKQIGNAKSKGEDITHLLADVANLGEELRLAETRLQRTQAALQDTLMQVPNLPHPSVPVGDSENANREVRRWGIPRVFDFAIKDHVSVGENLGFLDFPTAAKLSGARFSLMKGPLARLHRALAQFMLDRRQSPGGTSRRRRAPPSNRLSK